MPTTPFYLQQFRFLDGSPASGGKLYATVQGTETPAQLYLNPSLTTPAAQPLILSADGIAPQFWAPSTPGLCFKLKDPRAGLDTLVWTRDYISDGDGVNAPGTVTSVGLSLGAAMEAIADVSSSPVVTSGTIGLELAEQSQGKALMSPAAGNGKPAFRRVEFPKLKFAVSYPSTIWSPSVGDQYMVGERSTPPEEAFAGHGGEIAEWTGSGWEFWPISGSPLLITDSNQAFYRRNGGWYQYWRFDDFFGTPTLNFSGVPLYCEEVRDYSGSGLWKLNADGLNIRTGLTGTNFLSASINLSGHGNFSSVRTGTPSNPSVWTERISALGAGFLTSLTVSGETTLNGAVRTLWDGGINAVVISNDTALATQYSSAGGSWTLASNAAYSSGAWRAIDSHTLGTSHPRLLQMSIDGSMRYFTDIVNAPVAGVAAALTLKWSINKEGGMGAFGVTPPTARPTISGGRGSSATLQTLYQALGATGLILDSTTATSVTREASVTPMTLAGASGTPAIVNCVDANMLAYGFAGSGPVESLQYAIDFDHNRIAEQPAIVHVHWLPNTTGTGDVGFKLYYQWTEAGAVWQPATLFPTVAVAAGGVAWADKQTAFSISGAGKSYNSRLLVRLIRDSSDPLDTYAGHAVLGAVGCHYQADPGQA